METGLGFIAKIRFFCLLSSFFRKKLKKVLL